MVRLAGLLVALAACGGGGAPAGPSPHPTPTPRTRSPVAVENDLPGDAGWRLRESAPPGVLEGYAGAVSVEHGEAIALHVRSDRAATVRWGAWRLGWYHGVGGRLLASGGPVDVGPEAVPAPAPVTSLVDCGWPVSFTISTASSWTSGIYLVVLTRDDGAQAWVPFVVRADERKGAAAVEVAVTTWQAYNHWGGHSLYTATPAAEVSFDRPYQQETGAGLLFRWEQPFLEWAESRGFDLVYLTGPDIDRDPSLLSGQRLFVLVGHDEYWSRPQREAVEAALAAGTSLAAFAGNSVYWQIRLEDGQGGARRTEVCWKKRADTQDPLRGTPLETTRWRDPPVNEPESALMGVLFTALEHGPPSAWLVTDASAWPYDGTGLSNGDQILGVVGYETDRTDAATPAGTVILAKSAVADASGHAELQEATVRDVTGGGFVFATGTIDWPLGLAAPGDDGKRVRRITENVLLRAGIAPDPAAGPEL